MNLRDEELNYRSHVFVIPVHLILNEVTQTKETITIRDEKYEVQPVQKNGGSK